MIFWQRLIRGGKSETLMLDECICSFLLVVKNYLAIIIKIFVRIVNVLWAPYRVFEKGKRRKNNIR